MRLVVVVAWMLSQLIGARSRYTRLHAWLMAAAILTPAAPCGPTCHAADEHVLPTLLAMHGRDNETDCQGWLMGALMAAAVFKPWWQGVRFDGAAHAVDCAG